MQTNHHSKSASFRKILDRPKNKSLNSDQLLLEVVDMMLKFEINDIDVYEKNVKIGDISYAEVAGFLSEDAKSNLLFHKLNYTVSSFLAMRTR